MIEDDEEEFDKFAQKLSLKGLGAKIKCPFFCGRFLLGRHDHPGPFIIRHFQDVLRPVAFETFFVFYCIDEAWRYSETEQQQEYKGHGFFPTINLLILFLPIPVSCKNRLTVAGLERHILNYSLDKVLIMLYFTKLHKVENILFLYTMSRKLWFEMYDLF